MELLVIILALIVLVVAAVFVYRSLAGAKRRKTLAAWAKSKALSFNPARTCDMDSSFPDFKCLHPGSHRFASNIITGQLGEREIIAFDYHTEGKETVPNTGAHESNSRGRHFSVMIVNASLPLKPLFIRPEVFFDRIAEFFGADDIDFESAEFSRKFFVKSPDKKWASDVIHPQMMKHLLEAPKFGVQFADQWIIAWRLHLFTPGDFQAAFDLVDGILERLIVHPQD